ncbi:MAG: ABC transporter ATP-binding protein [Spirochaetaceae bacterium]|jgi:simple sugar transport system ATP-binding protein|nr:ABC transporter ATP-binding protein [Spirochaetaceae bacterium]
MALLSMKNIVKVYPNGVVANNGVDFEVEEGEIHALSGENGAGKSTLMKIAFGMEQPTSGEILYEGKPVRFRSPVDAIESGLGMVHQHFMLVESMSVAENIALGLEPVRGPFLDGKKIREGAALIIKKYGFDIDPQSRIRDLPTGTRQKVEILKALFRNAKLLILDEPTAVLTPQETTELFGQLKRLRDMGHTIIFISHKLGEIKEICDRITVTRGGKSIGVWRAQDLSKEQISALMVGKELDWSINKTPAKPGKTVLEVKDLGVVDEAKRRTLDGVSFSLHEGQILGIVGVEGNGQRELVEAVTGLRKSDTGTVTLFGTDIEPLNIKAIRAIGMSHIPQDRMDRGAALNSAVEENLISVGFDTEFAGRRHVFINKKKTKERAFDAIRDYQIKTQSPDVPVKMLSGGNIQKVVVAREFSRSVSAGTAAQNAGCIIADQPTRGIDVGAAGLIHKKLIAMRDEGAAVLLISADLSEVMDLSDSLIVMYGGKMAAYFPDAATATEEELGRYMLGIKKQSDAELAKAAG